MVCVLPNQSADSASAPSARYPSPTCFAEAGDSRILLKT
jgi:hypothetical protein